MFFSSSSIDILCVCKCNMLGPITITIIHGTMDEIVPIIMGRKVYQAGYGKSSGRSIGGKALKVKFKEIKNGDHNRILSNAQETIFEAMGR